MAQVTRPYEVTFRQKFVQKLRELKGTLREVWSYGTGRAGLVLLVILVSISIYAALTMPPNFVDNYWDNIGVLVENPDVVPPEWTKYFGVPYAPHVAVVKDEPDVAQYLTRTYIVQVNYTLKYTLEHPIFPKGILVRLKGILIDRQRMQGPRYKLYLRRPDDIMLLLVKDAIKITSNTSLVDSRAYVNSYYDILLSEQKLNYIDILKYLITNYAKKEGILYLNETSGQYYIKLTSADGKEFDIDLGTAISLLKKEVTLNPISYIFGDIVDMKPILESSTEGGYKLSGIQVLTRPLTGKYELTLELNYIGIMTHIDAKNYLERPVLETKMIFKGTIFGLMGTDSEGHDLALGLLYGFPVAMSIGLVVAVITSIIGLLVGTVSGYYGGIVDEVVQRIIDVMGNIPLLPILILLANIVIALFPNNPVLILLTILLILVVFGWGGLAIITRSMTLSIKEEPYVEAAKALGSGNRRILFKHIIPQIIPYIVASMVFSVPNAILTEAGLSVIGIRHGLPTWGAILASANTPQTRAVAMRSWWWIIPPGLLISITSLAFVLLGMALEKIVEPRFRTA